MGSKHPHGPDEGMPYLAIENYVDFGPDSDDNIDAIPAAEYQFYEVIRFVPSDKTIAEADYYMDLDGDDEWNTVFTLGRLEWYYPPATTDIDNVYVSGLDNPLPAVTIPITGDIILWDMSDHRTMPPIFHYENGLLKMNLLVASISDDNTLLSVEVKTQIALHNQTTDWLDPRTLPPEDEDEDFP